METMTNSLVEIMRDVPGGGDNRQNDRDRNRDPDRNQERENPKDKYRRIRRML